MGPRPEQRILWGLAVPASALAVLLIFLVTRRFVPETYPPDAHLFLSVWAGDCRPEPLEQLRYVLSVILVALVLWAASVYARRRTVTPAGAAAWTGPWASAVEWLLCLFVVAAVVYQEVYIRGFVDWPAFAAVALGLALLALAWRHAPRHWLSRWHRAPGVEPTTAAGRALRILARATPWLLALAVAAIELAPGWIRKERAFGCSPAVALHYPIPMGEFAAAANGRTALVNFFPQYQNLLGYALAPLFRLVGFDVYTFSAAMTLLSLALLLCFFAAFRQATGGAWRALPLFVPFVWVSMAPMVHHLINGIDTPVNTFTYLPAAPLRYLGPAVTLAVLVWFLGRPGRLRMLVLFTTAAAAALNNLDFGLPALAAAFLAVLFGSESGPVPRGRTVLGVGAACAAGVALVLGAFVLGTYLRSGRLPDFGMAVAYQRAFAVNGFAMLPMPPFGLHWAFGVTFLAAVAVGLFDRTAPRARRALLLYAGTFGPGALMYYVGRSHPNVLITIYPAWAFAFLLLAWSCWADLAPRLRSLGWRALTPAAVLLALGYAAVAGRLSDRPDLVAQFRRLTTKQYAEDFAAPWMLGEYRAVVACLRSHTTPGESVAVIAPAGHLEAAEAGVVNVFPFACSNSVLLQAQLDAMTRAIRTADVRTVVADKVSEDLLVQLVRLGYRRRPADSPLLWRREENGPSVAVWWGAMSCQLPNPLERSCGPDEILTVFNPNPGPRRVTLRLRCTAASPGEGVLSVHSPSGPQSWGVDGTGADVFVDFEAPPGLTRVPFHWEGKSASSFCYTASDFAVADREP